MIEMIDAIMSLILYVGLSLHPHLCLIQFKVFNYL